MDICFMKGNEVVAEAAIRTGVDGFFFYPLTPSSEIGEYMASHLEQAGGRFVQAESEIAAINMIFGAAAAGSRVMTGTSGVGFCLMTECLSYMAGAQVPCVVADVMRAGPGLGSLEPTQADYNQVAKACGHGGALIPCLAPATAQEIADYMRKAFTIAEQWRTPVVVAYDAFTGQVMENVTFSDEILPKQENNWSFDDQSGRTGRVIRSGYAAGISEHTKELYEKFDRMAEELQEWEEYQTQDADLVLVAFGIVGRVCRSLVDKARSQGMRIGLIRPISLNPFPRKAFCAYRSKEVQMLVVEMNNGMMVDDVIVALGSSDRVHFYRNEFAQLPTQQELMEEIEQLMGGKQA